MPSPVRLLLTAVAALLVATAALPGPVLAQRASGTLAGRVVDDRGAPLAAVRVEVVELRRVARTDDAGRFRVARVAPGEYQVSVARLGFAPVVRRVAVAQAGTTTLDVALAASQLELAPVQVTATAVATTALTSPQPTTVLAGAALRTAQGTSVGETLDGVPGVRSLSMSTGIGKPVIRGLTSNRVVVLDDGQRLETQQWGSDHAPNIETVSADRIEVLRGPASVLYGSDALGGVINVVRAPLPDAIGARPLLRGSVVTGLSSNPRLTDGTLTAEAASGGVGARASLTARGGGDMRTPVATLRNTGNRTLSGDAALGLRGAWGSVAATWARRGETIEIYEDPLVFPSFSGFQEISEQRFGLRLALPMRGARLEATAGYEENHRSEFDSVRAGYVALGLRAATRTGQVNYHHPRVGRLAGTLGVSAIDAAFDKFGRETLIPDSRSRDVGVYAFEQAELGRLRLSAGARYDWRTLAADGDPVLRLDAQSRRWQAFTGNVGLLYQLREPVALVVNVGRGFRAPSNSDLFANGYHEGTRAFERGDPALGVETSLNVDLALRAQSERLSGEAGVFVNAIRDYIYLRPAGGPGRELDTLDHAQGNAQLRGFEASAEYRPRRAVRLRAAADYTRGENTTLGLPLTFIPPLRATYSARFERRGTRRLRTPYLLVGGETTAPQRRLFPGDVGTGGYTLATAGAGVTLLAGARVVTADAALRNAFDAAYRNFMSQYKTIAHAPGRTLTLRLTSSW
jgi:iron complex outermembrane receptor protein